MATGPSGGAFARLGADFYDPCPQGTTEVPAGRLAQALAVRALPSGSADPSAATSPLQLVGPIASAPVDAADVPGNPAGAQSRAPRVCGGRLLGTQTTVEDGTPQSILIYDHLLLLAPSTAPNFVEVLIDDGRGAGYRTAVRVRY